MKTPFTIWARDNHVILEKIYTEIKVLEKKIYTPTQLKIGYMEFCKFLYENS